MNQFNLKTLKMKRTALLILFMLPFVTTVYGQNGSIKGKIVSNKEEPVPNVHILILGSSKGTTTNKSGEFEIKNVKPGSYRLRASSVGYKTQQQRVTVIDDEEIKVDFVLVDTPINLKEVSITATGVTKSNHDISGSVSVIDNKTITESGAQNIGEIITRAPGVNFLDEDGRGLKPNIGLRGLNPNRDRSVLVLVDGKFPVGMTL